MHRGPHSGPYFLVGFGSKIERIVPACWPLPKPFDAEDV